MNGFDLSTAAGRLQGVMEHGFPVVVGKDFAGTVEAIGDGVEAFTVGDTVFGVVMKPFLGDRSLAQFLTVPVPTAWPASRTGQPLGRPVRWVWPARPRTTV